MDSLPQTLNVWSICKQYHQICCVLNKTCGSWMTWLLVLCCCWFSYYFLGNESDTVFCFLAQWPERCNHALQISSWVLPLQKSSWEYFRVVNTVVTHQCTPPLHTKQRELLVVWGDTGHWLVQYMQLSACHFSGFGLSYRSIFRSWADAA